MTTSKFQKNILKAYNSSINFLAARTRSSKEVRDNLSKKKFKDDVITEVLLMIEKEGLLNDSEFAAEFVSTREKIRPKSKFALRYELKKKGISDAIIEDAVKNIDECKSALAAIDSKLSIWLKLDKTKMKSKMMNFLKNRGFNWEISFSTYEKICENLKNQENIK
ncbi:MAG: recombination regulator RecX [Desulfobacteraceae bacterium]|nr:recombination regulator RecX [Desulfobacteraceae bacterium]